MSAKKLECHPSTRQWMTVIRNYCLEKLLHLLHVDPESVPPLPNEITAEIFLLCLPDFATAPEPSSAPLLLGQICKQWRGVALSTPRLWCSLTLSKLVSLDLIHDWLERAGSVPLSLHIRSRSIGYIHPTFMPIIFRYGTRWETLDFDEPRHLAGFTTSTPHFTSFAKLILAYCDGMPRILLFKDTPHLREVHLTHEGCTLSPVDSLIISWDKLTSFTGYLSCPWSAYRTLRSLPNLIHCRLSAPDHDVLPDLPAIPPFMHMQSLAFLPSTACSISPILNPLTAPALRTLDVASPLPSDLPAIHAFLRRSACQIMEFSMNFRNIDDTIISPSVLPWFFDIMPTLTTLSLAGTSSNLFICALLNELRTSGVSPHALLPNLKHITIVHEGTIFPCGALLEMLRTKSASNSPLNFVFVRWSKEMTRPDHRVSLAFQELSRAGMHIDIGAA
ncbi:hypothetical protein C8J57DRAFT_1464963 [Mycena rebaudengoi]|nr:hypothetical protein C8J57DRAFT_1464963 [Mycena rebaudengoi]